MTWSNTARRRSATTRSPVVIIRKKRNQVASARVAATASTPASAWSSRRGSPLPKPPSTTWRTPCPSASTQAAANTRATMAPATRSRYGSRKRASRARAALRVDTLHLHPAVVEGGAAAEVAGALRGHVVGVAAVARVFLPPHRGRDHHARTRLAVDARLERVAAAVVENPYAVAVADAARRRVLRMHVEVRLALEIPEPRQVGEAGVEEMARRRRQEGEREARRKLSVGRLGRRIEERQRVDALPLEPGAMQLALAGGGGKPARGERREPLGQVEALPARLFQGIEIR